MYGVGGPQHARVFFVRNTGRLHLSLRGRHDPRRIAQCGMIAFRTHFEVALVELNHSGAVADGHDRRLR